jgi:hypothetical protein
MPDFSQILHQIFQEHFVYGHLPYVLLVGSVLMRDIRWLRIIAIVAGLLRIYIRAEIVYDPVTVMWESALVLINVGQLVLIWWDNRHSRLSEDEQYLARSVLQGESRATAVRLIRSGEWRDIEPGTELTVEGEKVRNLMFVADGAARIVKGDKVVAICSRGDFLGEMSFISGASATATAIADKPMRIISFDHGKLTALMDRDPRVRRAIEGGFNRDLMGKLVRSTGAPAEGAT